MSRRRGRVVRTSFGSIVGHIAECEEGNNCSMVVVVSNLTTTGAPTATTVYILATATTLWGVGVLTRLILVVGGGIILWYVER